MPLIVLLCTQIIIHNARTKNWEAHPGRHHIAHLPVASPSPFTTHIPYPDGCFTAPTAPSMSNLGTNPSSCAQTPLSGYSTRITNPMYMFVAPALCDYGICINVAVRVCCP